MDFLFSLLPYCPICFTSFTQPQTFAYTLQCGHFVCAMCVQKLYYEGWACCPFDAQWTMYNVIQSHGDMSAGLMQLVNSHYHRQDLVQRDVEQRFRYDRTCLPCPVRQPHNMCRYDHTGQLLKAVRCPYQENCPNLTQCIFIHPNDKTIPNFYNSVSSPSANAPTMGVPQSLPIAPGPKVPNQLLNTAFYNEVSYVTSSRLSGNFAPQEAVKPVTSWTCGNCGQLCTGQKCTCGLIQK